MAAKSRKARKRPCSNFTQVSTAKGNQTGDPGEIEIIHEMIFIWLTATTWNNSELLLQYVKEVLNFKVVVVLTARMCDVQWTRST